MVPDDKVEGWSAEVRRAFHEPVLFAGVPFNIAIGMWLPVFGMSHAMRSFWPIVIAVVIHAAIAWAYSFDPDFIEVWARSRNPNTDFLDAD